MVDVAKARMFGMDVGAFRWDSEYDAARFEYSADFIDKGIEPSPLMMPVRQASRKQRTSVGLNIRSLYSPRSVASR